MQTNETVKRIRFAFARFVFLLQLCKEDDSLKMSGNFS